MYPWEAVERSLLIPIPVTALLERKKSPSLVVLNSVLFKLFRIEYEIVIQALNLCRSRLLTTCQWDSFLLVSPIEEVFRGR